MSLSSTHQGREWDKFVADANGNTAIRTVSQLLEPFAPPSNSDAFTVTYPTTTTEVYRYYSGGTGGTLLKTITLTYSTPAKTSLVSGVVT